MNRPLGVALLVIAMSVSTGCATVLRGETQKVKFQTNAPDATVNIDGKDHKAPVEVALRRKDPHTIIVSAPGYQSIKFDLNAQWDGASLPDLAPPGGSVLFAADMATGADRKFYTLATINLDKANGPADQPVTMYEFRGKVMNQSDYQKSKQDLQDFHREQSLGGP